MLVGQPLLATSSPRASTRIVAEKVYFPKSCDRNAKALVKKTWMADLCKRYGDLKDGPDNIRQSKRLATNPSLRTWRATAGTAVACS